MVTGKLCLYFYTHSGVRVTAAALARRVASARDGRRARLTLGAAEAASGVCPGAFAGRRACRLEEQTRQPDVGVGVPPWGAGRDPGAAGFRRSPGDGQGEGPQHGLCSGTGRPSWAGETWVCFIGEPVPL